MFRVEYQQLYQIINAIGEASSFAQGLNNIITTAEKLQSSDHLLYLMKEDDEALWVEEWGKEWVLSYREAGQTMLVNDTGLYIIK